MRLLNKGEMRLMECVWNAEEELSSNEIAEKFKDDRFGKPSVFKAIKSLERDGFLEVSSLVLVSKIYARKFVPGVSKEEYMSYVLEQEGLGLTAIKDICLAMLARQRKSKKTTQEREQLVADLEELLQHLKSGAK